MPEKGPNCRSEKVKKASFFISSFEATMGKGLPEERRYETVGIVKAEASVLAVSKAMEVSRWTIYPM